MKFDISVPSPKGSCEESFEDHVVLHEFPMNDETGGSLWDGAVVLAKYLEHRSRALLMCKHVGFHLSYYVVCT